MGKIIDVYCKNLSDISPVGYGDLRSRLKIKTPNQVREKLNRRIEIRIVPKFGSLFKK